MKRRKFLPVFGLHVCEKQSSSAMLCNTTVSAAARLTRTAVWLSSASTLDWPALEALQTEPITTDAQVMKEPREMTWTI
jgi:hypothetical protein